MLRLGILEKDFFDSFMNDFAQPAKARFVEKTMKTDLKELEDKYELFVDVPGVKRKNISVELKDGYLSVTAKVEEEELKENEKYVHRERYCGTCNRKVFVGHELNKEDIKAKFENGVLKVSIPKKEEKRKEDNLINID